MLWDAVLAGLRMLTYWETYVAGLEYLAIYIIPTLLFEKFMRRHGGGSMMTYASMLVIPLIEVAALLVFILTLATIIFGFNQEAAWGFPWDVMLRAPLAFFIITGVLVIASFTLSLLPVLGRLHPLQTLVLGGLALVFVLSMFDSVSPNHSPVAVNFFPGLWLALGLMVMGGLMSWVGTLVSALVVGRIKLADERLAELIMIPVTALFGFIPLFMYGAWLGAQVRGGF
jgi:hypothetical protein